MTILIIFLAFALAAFGLFLYFAFRPQPPLPEAPPVPQTFTVESFFDLHARHFAHLKQALAEDDYNYLQRRGQARLARRLRRERLNILANYVEGLKDDFENLLHLRRVLGRLELEVARQHESQVQFLRLQFALLYSLVRLKLALARLTLVPVDVEPLVALVNRTAQATEAALNTLAEAQARQLRTELS